MQPILEMTVTRAWHWGIAVVVGDPRGEIPTDLGTEAVAAGRGAVVLSVRHAQDVEAQTPDGDPTWATASVHVRVLAEMERTDREVLCDVVVDTPGRTVALGDADGDAVVPAPGLRTRVVVSVEQIDPAGVDRAWIDLVVVDRS